MARALFPKTISRLACRHICLVSPRTKVRRVIFSRRNQREGGRLLAKAFPQNATTSYP
jgi:hypothetical protein